VLGDDGRGSTSDIIRAIDFVASEGQRPAVISMSLGCGSPCQSQAETRAIQSATNAGVVVIVAAGNNGNTNIPDACQYAPSDVPEAITVGSITINDDFRSSFSNIGNCIDIFAPGSDILSASAANDESGSILSGTSMACPHVSGVAALILGASPNLSPNEVTEVIVNEALEGNVKDTQGSPNKLLFIGNINSAPGVDPGTSNKQFAVIVGVGVFAILLSVACFIFRRRIKGKLFKFSKQLPSEQTKESKPKEPTHEWKVANLRSPKWCHQCNKFLWGFTNQGYECGNCHQIVCRICTVREGPEAQRCTACVKSDA